MNKLLRLSLALPLLLCLTSRAEETKAAKGKLVGTWEAVKGSETLPLGSTLEFSKDGKLKLVIKQGDQSQTIAGSYKMDGTSAFKATLKVGDKEHTEKIKIEKLTAKELVIVDDKDKKDVLGRKE